VDTGKPRTQGNHVHIFNLSLLKGKFTPTWKESALILILTDVNSAIVTVARYLNFK